MATMRRFDASQLRGLDATLWDTAKTVAAPFIWKWYDEHKDLKVAKLFGVYTVTISSFGIAELLLTNLIGPRPDAATTNATPLRSF